MEKIANNIAGNIASELNLGKDKEEVIAYGTFALMQILVSIGLVIIFGIIFKCLIEALIISFSTSILRKYSGGVHAGTPALCTIIGTVLCIGQSLFIKYAIVEYAGERVILILSIIACVWAIYTVKKYAPVDSKNKPIKKIERRKRMKKASLLVLCVYFVIVFLGFFVYIYTYNKLVYTYIICLMGGFLWQVFTLTNTAHLVFGKADTFFKYICEER